MPGEDTVSLADDTGIVPDEPEVVDTPVVEEEVAETDPSGEADSVTSTLFDDIDPEDLKKTPAIEKLLKAQEASIRESERQKQEHAANLARQQWEQQRETEQYNARQRQSEQMRRGVTANALKNLIRHSQETGEDVNQTAIDALANHIAGTAAHEAFQAVAAAERDVLLRRVPGYRPPQELAGALESAARSGNFQRMVDANTALHFDAAVAYLAPFIEAHIRQELATEATANTIKQNAGTPRPRPTAGIGARPSPRNLDAVLSDPTASEEARNKAFKEKHGFSL